jgi:quinol monooxygenase YgiN
MSMITVLARIRADSWDRFKAVHDEQRWQSRLEQAGNVSHVVLRQLDDQADVVFIDRWHYPQDADDYYFADAFMAELAEMGGQLVEIIKLEATDAAQRS